jgi:hypothetical protein
MTRSVSVDEIGFLTAGEYAVGIAERATGILLEPSGKYALGSSRCYQVFASLPAAKACAESLAKQNPLWESWVLDHTGAICSPEKPDPSHE